MKPIGRPILADTDTMGDLVMMAAYPTIRQMFIDFNTDMPAIAQQWSAPLLTRWTRIHTALFYSVIANILMDSMM